MILNTIGFEANELETVQLICACQVQEAKLLKMRSLYEILRLKMKWNHSQISLAVFVLMLISYKRNCLRMKMYRIRNHATYQRDQQKNDYAGFGKAGKNCKLH
jgi:hypothetical protein